MFANTQGGGIDHAFPNVNLTPPAPVPVPYPSIAQGSMATNAVPGMLVESMPAHNMATVVPMTDGDSAGAAGGVTSGTMGGPSRSVTGANSVLFRGKPATRLSSQTIQNANNASGARVTPSQTKLLLLAP